MDDVAPDARRGRAERLLLAGALLVAAVLRLSDFTAPFNAKSWHSLDAFAAIIARNWVEHGHLATRLAPALDVVPPADGAWELYLHHPPLVPLLVSFSFRLFGVHEWSARLVPVLASLLGVLAISSLTRRLFGREAALVAALLAAVVPATAFYGSLADDLGPCVIAFSAAAFALHLRQLERPSAATFGLMMAALLAAALSNWQGVEMAGLIGLLLLLRGRRRAGAAVLGLGAAVPALHLLHVGWATGSLGGGSGASMLAAFLHRTLGGIDTLGGPAVVLPTYASQLTSLYTAPVLALAAVGLARLRRSRWPLDLSGLLAVGVLDVLVFMEGSVRHEYWIGVLAPSLLCLAGAGAWGLARRLPPRAVRPALALAALAVAAPAALRTVERYERIEGEEARELGLLIAEHTAPDEVAGTCEVASHPLLFYARRRVVGSCTDDLLPPEGLPPLRSRQKLFIPGRHLGPHSHARLLERLRERYHAEVVRTRSCGLVTIVDLGRPRDGT